MKNPAARLTIPLSLLLLTACASTPERNIVAEFGFTSLMGMIIADTNNLEAVTELSSQIVQCDVISTDSVTMNEMNLPNFRYSVEVTGILLDISSTLEKGDVISVTSTEGIMKASEAAALVKDTPRAKKLGILQGEYGDNDYILSSTFNAVPIECGRSYIMFLSDEYLEKEGAYAESGMSYLYEIKGNTVRIGKKREKSPLTKSKLLYQLESQIYNRTGRADKVGASQYIQELAEKQNQLAEENE